MAMQISVIYSRFCSLWLFCSQILFTIGLWHAESDVGTLFGSESLDRVFRQLLGPDGIGTIALLVLGILVVSVYVIKERGLGLNTAWALSGIVYTILVFISAVLIWSSLPELYSPPPGSLQYLRVGCALGLDAVTIIAARRFLRRYSQEGM